jgi:sporulation protein YlmC with PRC-barrel domain
MTRISVAIAALLIAAPAAFAQTTTTTPATSPPAAAPSTASGAMKFYSSTPGQMRASKLIGLNVKNNANETIGEINELILDKDGKVAAVVIGVGGFLGIGQREVAIDYKSLNVKYDPNAMTDAGATTVTVDATKDSLKAAPAWTGNSDKNTGGTATPQRAPASPGGTTR